jgi:3-phosphoshikimate 1-carboxyvinyltransferase
VSGHTFPPFLDLPPLASARGTVRLPGSKSISNRTLLLAALGTGATRVRDVLDSDDTRRMLEALTALGVDVAGDPASGEVVVTGCGGQFPVREADLFLGNAGTAFRPLTAALAVAGGNYKLSGVSRMHERPIGDLVDALRSSVPGSTISGRRVSRRCTCAAVTSSRTGRYASAATCRASS